MSIWDENLIGKVYAGSHSYGTNIETSDVDIRGIFCGSRETVRTPFYNCREVTIPEEEDTKLYELSHFMKLCVDCNPNVIESLWVRDSDVIQTSPSFSLLRDNNEALLSKKIAYTTIGYASSQLKRLVNHKELHNSPNPPTKKPQQREHMKLQQWLSESKQLPSTFNIEEYNKDHIFAPYGNDLYGLYTSKGNELFAEDGNIKSSHDERRFFSPIAIVSFSNEQFTQATNKYNHYNNWVASRNPTRAKMEQDFGYDGKHAMHLIRLLRMGKEVLETGILEVFRSDADDLIAIRNGDRSYASLIEEADDLKGDMNSLLTTSPLRPKPNIQLAADLMLQVQDMVWSGK